MATPSMSRLRGITLCYDWPVTLKRLGRGTLKVTNTDERFWIWGFWLFNGNFSKPKNWFWFLYGLENATNLELSSAFCCSLGSSEFCFLRFSLPGNFCLLNDAYTSVQPFMYETTCSPPHAPGSLLISSTREEKSTSVLDVLSSLPSGSQEFWGSRHGLKLHVMIAAIYIKKAVHNLSGHPGDRMLCRSVRWELSWIRAACSNPLVYSTQSSCGAILMEIPAFGFTLRLPRAGASTWPSRGIQSYGALRKVRAGFVLKAVSELYWH